MISNRNQYEILLTELYYNLIRHGIQYFEKKIRNRRKLTPKLKRGIDMPSLQDENSYVINIETGMRFPKESHACGVKT